MSDLFAAAGVDPGGAPDPDDVERMERFERLMAENRRPTPLFRPALPEWLAEPDAPLTDRLTGAAAAIVLATDACPVCGAAIEARETEAGGISPAHLETFRWGHDVVAARFTCGLHLGVWNCGIVARWPCQAATSAAVLSIWDRASAEAGTGPEMGPEKEMS